MRATLVFSILLALLLVGCRKENRLQKALDAKTGAIEMPAGTIELQEPLVIDGANNLTLIGNGRNVLRVAAPGKAALIIHNSKNVRLENFTIEGNRDQVSRRFALPPSDQPMARFNDHNGVLIENSEQVTVEKLTVRNVASYAILVTRSKDVTVQETLVGDSGSVDEKGHNNATGGILFEEGCERFAVKGSKVRNVRGNGIWTHSMYTSPRNRDGVFEGNDVRYVGRDGLQAGHAVNMRIVNNTGGFVGFPADIVDLKTGAVPAAIDTAGNVENSVYADNSFEEINGKCFDLDGFHDGSVERNVCVNRRDAQSYPHGHYGIVLNNSNPDMESKNIRITQNKIEGFRFGGIFLIGSGHVVTDNEFRKINLAGCNENLAAGCLYKADEPDLLRSGIYLGKGAERPGPATSITIENNVVQGHGMAQWCIVAAPGVSKAASRIGNNVCSN